METMPGGEGICVVDTDLEVDFAPPVGYVEPERPKAAPPATMASKLKIDLSSASPGSSRPASSLSGGFTAPGAVVSKDGDQWESFKGKGETLGGRKTKGKGISHRKPEKAPESSKIIRTDQHRIVSNSTLPSDVKVPAALTLPFGQLFFGFNVTAYTPPPPSEPPSSSPSATSPEPAPFTGSGNTLSGRGASSAYKGKEKEKAPPVKEKEVTWGTGHTLGARSATSFVPPSFRSDVGSTGSGGPQRTPHRNAAKQKERSPSPDWGVDDDDVIMVDSD